MTQVIGLQCTLARELTTAVGRPTRRYFLAKRNQERLSSIVSSLRMYGECARIDDVVYPCLRNICASRSSSMVDYTFILSYEFIPFSLA